MTADDAALQLVLALHRLVRSLRTPGQHPTRLLLLVQLIQGGPQRIGELADRIPCSQPTATTVANALAVEGLVRRVRDTSDGRAIQLQITDAGRAAVEGVVRGQADKLGERLTALAPAERAQVLAAVPVLRKMTTG
ncbi:MAG TPA: MarR family transcriptional regulator [Pseudonocardiaceae bacterium]|nr:MarR family transcriptional regulator [Pseudonocardiaceae bacterium]